MNAHSFTRLSWAVLPAVLMMSLIGCAHDTEDAFAGCEFETLNEIYSDLRSHFGEEVCIDAFLDMQYEHYLIYDDTTPPDIIYTYGFGIQPPIGLQQAYDGGIYIGDRIRVRGRLSTPESCLIELSDGSGWMSGCIPYGTVFFEESVYEVIHQPPPDRNCEHVGLAELYASIEDNYRRLVCLNGTISYEGDYVFLTQSPDEEGAAPLPRMELDWARIPYEINLPPGSEIEVVGWYQANLTCLHFDRFGAPPCRESTLWRALVLYSIKLAS